MTKAWLVNSARICPLPPLPSLGSECFPITHRGTRWSGVSMATLLGTV